MMAAARMRVRMHFAAMAVVVLSCFHGRAATEALLELRGRHQIRAATGNASLPGMRDALLGGHAESHRLKEKWRPSS
jgi:hypothetical protein